MGRTIIQPIGPLYGEAVNGTVFGRPNGSIYIPPTNTIEVSIKTGSNYLYKSSGNYIFTNSGGVRDDAAFSINAQSQDTASYIQIAIYSDAAAETIVTEDGVEMVRNLSAGLFNQISGYLMYKPAVTLVSETTYYLRCTLMSASGVPVAVSDILEVVAL